MVLKSYFIVVLFKMSPHFFHNTNIREFDRYLEWVRPPIRACLAVF